MAALRTPCFAKINPCIVSLGEMPLPDGPSNVSAKRVVIRTTNLEMGDACSNTTVEAVPIRCNHILEPEVPNDLEEILKQIQIPDLYDAISLMICCIAVVCQKVKYRFVQLIQSIFFK